MDFRVGGKSSFTESRWRDLARGVPWLENARPHHGLSAVRSGCNSHKTFVYFPAFRLGV
jgi:hypothetical protein